MIGLLKSLLKYFKNLVLVFVVFSSIIALFINIISQDKKYLASNSVDAIQNNRAGIYKTIKNSSSDRTVEGQISVKIYRIFACSFSGEACTDNPKDGDKNFSKSFLGRLDGLMMLPYANPPASGIAWAYSGLINSGFIPKTYAAQGMGFAAISPFTNIWKIFRDLSFMLLVIVLIAIGFMVMFRLKINPQTIISVENSLPRIVITIILITFSFAIAGFLIDLMYFLMALSISLISNNNTYFDATKVINEFISGNMDVVYRAMFPPGKSSVITGIGFLMTFGGAILNILGPQMVALIRAVIVLLGGLFLGEKLYTHINKWLADAADGLGIEAATFGGQIGGIPHLVISPFVAILVFGIAAFIAAFVLPEFIIGILLFVSIIFTFFRILFILFRAYLQIILLTILGPFILLFEAIPGINAFSYWFKGLLGEIITFPIIAALLVLSRVIVNTMLSVNNFWAPPFLTMWPTGLGINSQIFSYLVGMGLVFLIPDLIRFAKEALGIKPMPFSIGLGTFFGGAGTAVGGAMGLAGQYGSLVLAFPRLRGLMSRISPMFGEAPNKPGDVVSSQHPQDEKGKVADQASKIV